jgi:transcriptional regulator with XRE-family HTH domain
MRSISSHEYDIFRRCMIAARKEAQLTQESLAKSLQKPQSFVAKYENGDRRLNVVEFLIVTRIILSHFRIFAWREILKLIANVLHY